MSSDQIRDRLFDAPFSFDFFQAVRLLERLSPDKAPVGRYSNPDDEVVRFASHASEVFPASQIQSLTERPSLNPKMVVNFMGLIGPSGVLQTYITEAVVRRVRAHDTAMLDFFDIFSHRMISFFYQAWEKHHFTIAYERDRSDPVTQFLYSLLGFGTPHLRHRLAVRDETVLFYSGLFGPAPRSALSLETMLADYFGVDVEIEPFIGVWRKIEVQDQCFLTDEKLDSTSLGFGVIVGDEVWDQQSRVRVRIGPLSAERYQEFLPTGSAWPALRSLIRAFSRNDLEYEICPVLRQTDVPPCKMTSDTTAGTMLGWNTWLNSRGEFDHDADETLILLLET